MSLNKFIILFFIIIGVIQIRLNAQNLALNKSYILSTPPNYPRSASPFDSSSLTDGIYTKGNFWTQPTTVGWQLQEEVSITIDLGKIEVIGDVRFNTVRDTKVGISFPQNIFVFISNDNDNFRYIGDAADVSDNLPGNNEIKKFILDGIEESARYVTITCIPQGHYLFCDEIEVNKGKNSNNIIIHPTIKNSLHQFVDSLKTSDNNKRDLVRMYEKLQKNLTGINKKYNKKFSVLKTELNTNSPKDLRIIKNRIGEINASILMSKFNNLSFIVEKYNPWDSLSELRQPNENRSILNYNLSVSVNDIEYGSFIITNITSTEQQFFFKVSNSSISQIDLYQAVFVPTSYFIMIPDPLVKVNDSITINPGLAKMFLFKVTGIEAGTENSTITISSMGQNSKINLKNNILNPFKQIGNTLNVNDWPYFNNPMIRGREKAVAKDLKSHHVNTFVIPPVILPNLETNDFTTFISYLGNFKDARNTLLFMDYSLISRRSGFKNGQFMSTEWKDKFVKWYNNMVRLINSNSNTQIYLYPYDEVEENNIGDFKKLVFWAKKTIPGIKFYATLNTKIAIDSILPIVDIAQILPSLGGINKLPSHECEIWIYTGNTPSRAQSPYGYYRLMAWEAFVNDYKGIGFWNYADERNGSKLNLISDGSFNPRGSYSVIYDGLGQEIISSRRWEAFRLGIEDYSILQAYSDKYGIESAKAFAIKVVNNPDDLDLADSVRDKMITDLIKK